MAVKDVYFCLDHKIEVAQEDVEQHVVDHPSHHLIECIRGDVLVAGVEPVVEYIVPEEENEAIGQLVAALSGTGGVLGGGVLGGVGYSILTFSEGSLSKDDWAHIGDSNNTYSHHSLPFDSTLVGMSISYRKVQSNYQTVRIYNTLPEDLIPVYETPWIQKTNDPGNWQKMDLDIAIPSGTPLRVRGGSYNGQFSEVTITLVVKPQ